MSSAYNSSNFMPAGYEDDDDDFFSENNSSLSANVQKTCENMKITVVEDITLKAGLNDKSFDATLDTSSLNSFKNIKQIFGIYKRGPTLSQTIQQSFMNSTNPFLYALKFFANCSDCNSVKLNTLPYIMLEEINHFKLTKKPVTSILIDENLKMVSFNFVKKRGIQSLYKIVISAYELIIHKDLFISKIKELIKDNYYKEACLLSYELGLFNEFTIFEMILPLLLQDKVSIAEQYLDKAIHLQYPLLQLLDSFLDRSSTVQNICGELISKFNYADVKLNKIHGKPLAKLITRLAKKYKASSDCIPNVIQMKNYGAFQYIMHKKFYEKSLSNESWREMIKDTVAHDAYDLQLELITTCSYNECTDAIYWAKYFHFPNDKLCAVSQEFFRICEQQQLGAGAGAVHQLINYDKCFNTNNSSFTNDSVEDNHTLLLDPSNIIIVDDRDKFLNMIKYLAVQYLIAFDAEWKPTFSVKSEVAVIQLATKEKIYLIDVVTLRINDDDWDKLGKYIFNNDEIVKLAFAVTSDLKMFQQSIPALGLSRSCLNNSYIDLQDLWKKLNTIRNFKFPYKGDKSAGVALKNLVKLCLGKKLDKSDQFSNWEKRPLRQEQINYAALDAYCLIEIYEIIEQQLKLININFHEFINKYLTDYKIVYKTKQQPYQQQQQPQQTYQQQEQEQEQEQQHQQQEHAQLQDQQNQQQQQQQQLQQQQQEQRQHRQLRQQQLELRHHQQQQPQQHPKSWKPQSQYQNPSTIAKKLPIPIGPNAKPVGVNDVKFICDIMLDGLARKLRKYGIDVLVLSNRDDRELCIQIAMSGNRYILTRGSFYNRCVQYVPLGHCYKINSDIVDDQILEVINYYNITIKQENIFSRCVTCNYKEFIAMTQLQMKLMIDEFKRNINNNNNYNYNNNCNNNDNNNNIPSTSNYNSNNNRMYENSSKSENRTWILNNMPSKNSCLTNKGVEIQFNNLPTAIINSVQNFYVCENCGKCYWDGTHYDNFIKKNTSINILN